VSGGATRSRGANRRYRAGAAARHNRHLPCKLSIKNAYSALPATRSLRVAECREFFAGLQSIVGWESIEVDC
jgi:hypothetical protein